MTHSRRFLQRHRRSNARRNFFHLRLEPLEDRALLSVVASGVPDWTEQGPGPIAVGGAVGEQAGMVNGIAVKPGNPNTAFVASGNGGVWRSFDATAADPHWEAVTDQQQALSMAEVAFDPGDPAGETWYAGFGFRSNGFGDGVANPGGLLRSKDNGDTWTLVGTDHFAGATVTGIAPTTVNDPISGQQVVLVAAQGGDRGLFRSTDGGETFDIVSGTTATTDGIDNDADGSTDEAGELNLPTGSVTALVADPGNSSRFYTAIPGIGVFRTNNAGASWQLVNGTGGNVITGLTPTGMNPTASNIRILLATHNSGGNNVVYAGIIRNNQTIANGDNHDTAKRLVAVFRSTDQGANWRQLQNMPVVNPNSMAGNNAYLTAHPTDPNVLFVGGAATPRFRVLVDDVTPANDNWNDNYATGSNGSSPHADPRQLVFADATTAYESSDGGIYRLVNPDTPATRVWQPMMGDMRPTEFYSVAYDTLNNTIFGGTQDNGSPSQRANSDPAYPFTWDLAEGCDGSVAAVDNTSVPGFSLHYSTSQSLSLCGFIRHVVDAANVDAPQNVMLDIPAAGGRDLDDQDTNGNYVFDAGLTQFMVPYVLNNIDPSRMIIGTQFLYESTNGGDSLTSLGGLNDLTNDGIDNDNDGTVDDGDEFTPANPVGSVNNAPYPSSTPIAYGGRAGGVDNEEVLWVAGQQDLNSDGMDNDGDGINDEGDEFGGPQLRLRTSGTGLPAVVANYVGATIRDIVMDSDDWHTAYLVDANGTIFKAVTNDNGTNVTFSDLTGDLGRFGADMRTVEFVRAEQNQVLLVGGVGGVYRTINPDDSPSWSKLGSNLPNGLANDLRYTPPTPMGSTFPGDVLVVGTYGRGAWTIENASNILALAPTLNVCGDENQVNQDDQILLIRNEANPLLLDVFVNSVLEFEGPLAAIAQINVFGVGGNDELTVDSSFGLIDVPTGIRYDGDGACPDAQTGYGYDRGFDKLILDQDEGDTQDTDSYSVGPAIGAGTSIIEGPSGTQRVYFEELEPVIDLVPADDLVVNATAEPNAINYVTGSTIFRGLITIDNYESLEFREKEDLTINAGLGDDIVNLNNSNIPNELSVITVNADDGDDTITTRSGIDEDLSLILNGGYGNDSLDASGATGGATLNGGPGNDHLVGGSADDDLFGNDGNDLLVGGAGNNAYSGGVGFDTLLIQGTLGNDTIGVNQTGASSITSTVNGNTSIESIGTSIEQVQIDAQQGNDLIRVTTADNLPATSVQRFYVLGDAPNASDRLIVTDTGTGDLVVVRQAPDQRSGRVSVAPGVASPPPEVVYEGIERLDVLPVDPVTGGTGTGGGGQIKVFHSDPFEYNDNRLAAGQLARVPESATSPVIDPGGLINPFGDGAIPGDEDWYEFRPQATGTFRVKILFDTLATVPSGRPGLPGNGDLNLDIYDANGVPITSGVAAPGGKAAVFAATNDPAFSQFNRIFVRVRGAAAGSINIYDFDDLTGLATGNPAVSDVDTLGPQVTDVTVNNLTTAQYNLFGVKPGNAAQGPTPMVNSLDIHFQDLPPRTAGFLYAALDTGITPDESRGLFEVKGDANGIIAINNVIITNPFPALPGDIATATIRLVFAQPLPDDRFTLAIDDSLRDPVGNRLDGESNADEPNGGPHFPSGDGDSGGDFVARFTVDSRPEIGTYALGSSLIDINGNFIADQYGADRDSTNRDIAFLFGFRDDKIFAGDFAAAGALSASGFDKLGAYGNAGTGAAWHIRLDFNHDGVVDFDVLSGVQNSADPVAGNFSPAHPGDEIGLFNSGKWYLDTSGDNNVGGPGDTQLNGNMKGQPIVGDFDGDGLDDLAAWDAGNAGTQLDGTFQFDLANNGLTGIAEKTIQFDIAGTFQKAIAADMNGDGIDDIGLFVSRREAIIPAEAAEWYFLISSSPTPTPGLVTALNHPFKSVPFGNDLFAQFGDEAALPVVGNFDPPADSAALLTDLDHNSRNAMDVDNDGVVAASDVLTIINYINAGRADRVAATSFASVPFVDVTGDQYVAADDVVTVINYINSQPGDPTVTSIKLGAEGEAADAYFDQFSSNSDDDSADALWTLLASETDSSPNRRR